MKWGKGLNDYLLICYETRNLDILGMDVICPITIDRWIGQTWHRTSSGLL